MIVTGRHVPAEEAHRLGIIDELAPEGRSGRRRSPSRAASPTQSRCRASATATSGSPKARRTFSRRCANRSRAAPATSARPMPASRRSRRRAKMPFDEGCAFERKLFDELVGSEEARALRYAFFAEREVTKLPHIPAGTQQRPTEKPGVVGAGTMGGGIAMSFADYGFDVRITDATQEALDRGMARIRGNYETSVRRGSLSQDEMDKRLARIHPVAEHRRSRRLRCHYRGGVRADPGQGGDFQKARPGHEPGCDPVLEHVGDRHRHHGQCDEPAAGRRRHAFLCAGQCHEIVRGRPGHEKRAAT